MNDGVLVVVIKQYEFCQKSLHQWPGVSPMLILQCGLYTTHTFGMCVQGAVA